MPVYAYRCDSCGIQFDKKQKFTDDTLVVCPECNEKALRKLYTPVGIVFKGSGFYSTDHRSPSGQNLSKKSEAKESNSESKSETGKETKSESKDTSKTESSTKKSSD
jgi:putative FmdB family regulatory protein